MWVFHPLLSSALTNTFTKLKRHRIQSLQREQSGPQAVQQGRSERRGESYSLPYGEPLSDARTPLAGSANSLLDACVPFISLIFPIASFSTTDAGQGLN